MKAGVAILLLIVVALVALWLIGKAAMVAMRHWRTDRAAWEMSERSDGEQVVITAERPGQETLLIGAAAFAAADFDEQVYELRARGREQVYVLNQRNEK